MSSSPTYWRTVIISGGGISSKCGNMSRLPTTEDTVAVGSKGMPVSRIVDDSSRSRLKPEKI